MERRLMAQLRPVGLASAQCEAPVPLATVPEVGHLLIYGTQRYRVTAIEHVVGGRADVIVHTEGVKHAGSGIPGEADFVPPLAGGAP